MSQSSNLSLKLWQLVLDFFLPITQKPPELEGMLFLIGLREAGLQPAPMSKEDKQDLVQLGMCAILEQEGYFKREGYTADGWPQFVLLKPAPMLGLGEQEDFLKWRIANYLQAQGLILSEE